MTQTLSHCRICIGCGGIEDKDTFDGVGDGTADFTVDIGGGSGQGSGNEEEREEGEDCGARHECAGHC